MVTAVAWRSRSNGPARNNFGSQAEVTRGPLVVSVTESGDVEADQRKVIANQLTWPVVIKQVVPEGTIVKEDGVIIQFECKELNDAIVQQRITVTAAQNAYTQARENLLLKKRELANNAQKAEQAVQDAEESLERYIKGEWPVKKSDAASNIKLAERDLYLARQKLAFKVMANNDKELQNNKPYSQNEIDADQLSVDRLELALGKAKSTLDMLLQYDHKRDTRKLEIAGSDAKLELERAKLEAKTQLLVSEADAQTKKVTLEMQESKLADLLADERQLVVKAEKSGLVVYDTGSRWSGDVTIEAGQRISPKQQLMIIPDMSTLQIHTKVYEAIIDQVMPGLEAFIRLDAKPDMTLRGRATRVGVLPSSQHRFWNPTVKIFDVIVKLDDAKMMEGLKPGMTAQVELVLARLENVLSVPVAAVFTEQGQTCVWRVSWGKREKVAVKVGRMNDARVEVLSGLSQGDRVLLAPAEAQAQEPKEEQAEGPPGPPPPLPDTGPAEGAPPAPPQRTRGPRP